MHLVGVYIIVLSISLETGDEVSQTSSTKTEPKICVLLNPLCKITGSIQPVCTDNGNVKTSYDFFWHFCVHKASSASSVAGACRAAEPNQYGLPPNVRDLFSTDYPACVLNDTTDVLEM